MSVPRKNGISAVLLIAALGFGAVAQAEEPARAGAASSSELDAALNAAGTTKPKAAEPWDASNAAPVISGATLYVPGVPQLDVAGAQAPGTALKGQVSELGTIPGVTGKALLPELDCIGFSGQANAGGFQLKGQAVGNGKPGYHTDGGAWMIQGDYPVMVQVFEGDSCEQQGMQAGDLIVELNGNDTYKLSHSSILSLFRCWDANMRNHYTLKRGNQLFRIVTQVSWHPFGSGTYEEKLWKSTWSKVKY